MPGEQESLDSLRLDGIGAAVAACTSDGVLQAATAQAKRLLCRLFDGQHPVIPRGLWEALERVDLGHAVEWRPATVPRLVVGCTRYAYLDGYLLLMKEVSGERAATAGRMHGQRLEAIGRLVASIAHELRNSVASIVYCADLLSLDDVPELTRKETVEEILIASQRLQGTVAGLLDYARLGPTVSLPVSLREVLTRSQGFLRSLYSEGSDQLTVAIGRDAEWVQGNSLVIEQVFINLLLNAIQAAGKHRVHVEIRTDIAVLPSPTDPGKSRQYVRVRVSDDGPGVPPELRDSVFEPFFTTRPDGTGLGLSNARDAVETLGGSMHLEETRVGARFVVYLPMAARPSHAPHRDSRAPC